MLRDITIGQHYPVESPIHRLDSRTKIAMTFGFIISLFFSTNIIVYAIAAVVLGGINMSGGKGNLLGVFFGALSYTTINFIIVSIPALSTDIQDTFQGLVLIAVILVQTVGPVIKERFSDFRKHRKINQLSEEA
jgi:energy-coupling factor transporter transmembrane protein EcfT